MNGWVIPAEVSIPRAHEMLGDPMDPNIREQLENLARELVRYNTLLNR